jgi:hypothetical protein
LERIPENSMACRTVFVVRASYTILLPTRETPPSQTSCHLDAAGVASACKNLLDQIPVSDLVVLNKFGKLEGMGQGLASALELAIGAGKPVLTTVSDRHCDAWRTFAPETRFLPGGKAALQYWWCAIRPHRSCSAIT